MKEFSEVVQMKIIPAIFVLRCLLCGHELTNFDRHLGIIQMNEHIGKKHSAEVDSMGKEQLYSRKHELALSKF